MAKRSDELREWARIGAETRIRALQAEIDRIRTHFPETKRRGRPAKVQIGVREQDINLDPGQGKRKQKRRLSPEGRKAIAAAAKRRWAKVRAAKQSGAAKGEKKR